MANKVGKFALEILLVILSLVLVGSIMKYLNKANTEIKNIKNYKSNSYLASAQTRVEKARDATIWFFSAFSLAVVIFIVLLFFGISLFLLHPFIILILLSAIIIILYDGYEAAIAASDIKKSGVSNNNGSYSSLIKTGVLGLFTIIIIIAGIIYSVHKYNKRKNKT